MVPQNTCKFSAQALRCLVSLGETAFSISLEDIPWAQRPYKLSKQFILQKYLSNEDIVRAYWIQESVRRVQSNWYLADPGMSYLTNLLDERSKGRWRSEALDHEQQLPVAEILSDKPICSDTLEMLQLMRESFVQQRRANLRVVEANTETRHPE